MALDCSGPGSTKGPDGIGKGSVGILAGLAVTPEGRPPGLMHAAFRQEPGEDSRRRAGTGARGGLPGHAGGLRGRLPGAADAGAALLVRASQRVRTATRRACGSMSRPVTELTIPAARAPARSALSVSRSAQVAPPHCGGDAYVHVRGQRDGDEALLTTERPAQAEAVHAATVLRWSIETWFRTLKTRIKDRRRADDLKKCLAVHVLTVLAQERPLTPASEVFAEEDVDLLHTLPEAQGHRNVVRMADGKAPDIRAVVIDLGRLVGSHLAARQSLPGTKKVWQGLERLHWAIQVRDALGKRRRE